MVAPLIVTVTVLAVLGALLAGDLIDYGTVGALGLGWLAGLVAGRFDVRVEVDEVGRRRALEHAIEAVKRRPHDT